MSDETRRRQGSGAARQGGVKGAAAMKRRYGRHNIVVRDMPVNEFLKEIGLPPLPRDDPAWYGPPSAAELAYPPARGFVWGRLISLEEVRRRRKARDKSG
jgi:hypothetical protein